MSDPAPTCIACGYSLQGIERDASCPECGLTAAERQLREGRLDTVIPDRSAAVRALFWIACSEAAAAVICVAGEFFVITRNERPLLLLWFPFAAALVLCRIQWRSLTDSVQVSSRFKRFVHIRLAFLALFVPAITILANTPLVSMYAGPFLLIPFGLMAIWGLLSAAGSVAEILFLRNSANTLSASGTGTIGVFGWFSLLFCGSAWIMWFGGLPDAMLPLLAASYAMSAGMVLVAAIALRRVDRKLAAKAKDS